MWRLGTLLLVIAPIRFSGYTVGYTDVATEAERDAAIASGFSGYTVGYTDVACQTFIGAPAKHVSVATQSAILMWLKNARPFIIGLGCFSGYTVGYTDVATMDEEKDIALGFQWLHSRLY